MAEKLNPSKTNTPPSVSTTRRAAFVFAKRLGMGLPKFLPTFQVPEKELTVNPDSEYGPVNVLALLPGRLAKVMVAAVADDPPPMRAKVKATTFCLISREYMFEFLNVEVPLVQ